MHKGTIFVILVTIMSYSKAIQVNIAVKSALSVTPHSHEAEASVIMKSENNLHKNEQNNNCTGASGQLVVDRDWPNNKTLSIVLNSTHENITCFNYTGQAVVYAGGIGQNSLIVGCQDKNGCHIKVYANISLSTSTTTTESTPTAGYNCDGLKGQLILEMDWPVFHDLNAKLNDTYKIKCFNVEEQTKILYGGRGKDNVAIRCLDVNGCHIKMFASSAIKKQVFNSIVLLSLLITYKYF